MTSSTIAIVNGYVVPVSEEPIENGVVLVRDATVDQRGHTLAERDAVAMPVLTGLQATPQVSRRLRLPGQAADRHLDPA